MDEASFYSISARVLLKDEVDSNKRDSIGNRNGGVMHTYVRKDSINCARFGSLLFQLGAAVIGGPHKSCVIGYAR